IVRQCRISGEKPVAMRQPLCHGFMQRAQVKLGLPIVRVLSLRSRQLASTDTRPIEADQMTQPRLVHVSGDFLLPIFEKGRWRNYENRPPALGLRTSDHFLEPGQERDGLEGFAESLLVGIEDAR